MVAALVACDHSRAGVVANQGPVFRTISVNEGLPDRHVEAIVQDTRGYIWFGTRSGLVRHEGTRMRIIPDDPQAPNPLPGRNIMSLLAHSDGTVWAAVKNRGAVQIGPDLALLSHLEPEDHGGRLPEGNIWAMAEDCDGRVWLALMRGGVAVFDPASTDLKIYPQSPGAGLDPGGFQVHLEVDSRCRVWLVQTGQIAVIEPGQDRFQPVWTPAEGFFIHYLAEVGGRIYFNEGRRLHDLGPTAQAPGAEPVLVAELDGMITAIADDPHSQQIVLGSTSGLYRKSPGNSGQLRNTRHVPGLANALPSNSVDGLMFDREGGLWLTTTRSGAAYLPPGSAAFERYQPIAGLSDSGALGIDPVLSLSFDQRAGGFWVGGLRSELEFLQVEPDAEPAPALSESDRKALFGSAVVDAWREGDALYVATQARVVRIEPGLPTEPGMLMRREELDEGTFAWMVRHSAGRLWIATHDVGLILLDEESGRREHFRPEGQGRERLPETAPGQLLKGPQGRWWLLTRDDVYRFDEARGFVAQNLTAMRPLTAAVWHEHALWLAGSESLEQWRPTDEGGFEQVRQVELADRMPPGRTIEIVPDQVGGLWLVRTSGLFQYRPAEDHLRHFTWRDGLAPVEFGDNAVDVLPDGRLALGGRGGIVTVDPARIRGVSVAPRVDIMRLQAGDHQFELGPGSAGSVALDHDQNSFSVDFLATTWLAQDRTRYRVRLDGWDSRWIELVGQTRHHYSSLPAGRYHFKVRAAAPDGPWSEEQPGLLITIDQPPWLSGWALSAYALLGLAGAGAGLRSYRRANQRRREISEARHKRALAEAQRKFLTRLNRSLEPIALAEIIVAEIVRVTGGRAAWLGYTGEHLPRELIASAADLEPLTRQQWRRRLDQAGPADLALTLTVAGREVARVLVEGPFEELAEDGRESLRLLVEMAGQALHNALLLERVRALAAHARQASNAKSEFLATMSHEIRTPLHGVLGMVDLLYETETEPGQHDILETLRQSGLQLQRIIDDVLDISRIEAGRLSLNPQPFDLVATLEQVVDLHAPNAARKGLDLRLRLATELPLMATGDADRISQVLGNLLSNAVKFTERGGVELSAAVGRDQRLVLVVSDSGPGISARDRERLFEPFTQLDASITRSHSGSGLGLAICRRLVEAMDGTLDLLESAHGGARFRVRLPVLTTPSEPVAGTLSRLLDGLVVGASVSAPTLRVLRALGRRWGISVVDARAEPRPCDLLLVDPDALDDDEADRLEHWRRQATELAWLASPFLSHSGPPPVLPAGAHFLRWPLVESRFIGLLFDLRIGRGDAAGPNG